MMEITGLVTWLMELMHLGSFPAHPSKYGRQSMWDDNGIFKES